MAKFTQSISIAFIVSLAVCSASPARLETLKPSNLRQLAHQEIASDLPTQTPYPPAGIRPSIPFDLPNDKQIVAPVNYYLPPNDAPANFYLPPPSEVNGPLPETYGPPEVSVIEKVDEIVKDEPVQTEETQPDEQEPVTGTERTEPTQLPNEENQNAETFKEQDASELKSVTVQERVNNTLPQRVVLAKSSSRKIAKLQLRPVVLLNRQEAQPIYLIDASNNQLFKL